MDDYLPAALARLREADVVRLCGLARAARGQDDARLRRVRQAERAAGTLRAAVLDGETARTVTARFSDEGLEFWECSCSPAQSEPDAAPGVLHPPCEHVAALLSLWVREPEQFRAAPSALDTPSDAAPAAAPPVTPALPSAQAPPAPESADDSGSPAPAVAPDEALARLEHLDQNLSRFLNLLALAGGRVTEHEAQQFFLRFGLGEPEAALAALERLHEDGLAQPVFVAAASSRHAAVDLPDGWAIPEALLERLPRVLPLTPLEMASGAAEERSEARQMEAGLREEPAEMALPRLLALIAARMVGRSAPAPMLSPPQQSATRSTLDLDAVLAQQWAPQLGSTPEEARFALALLRLLGMLPPTLPARGAAEPARETLLSAYRLLLARTTAEAARDLFTHWLHAPSARELLELRDAGIRVAWLKQRRQVDLAAENQAARQFLVRLLRYAPAGRWWSFSSLVEFIWRFQPGFLRGHQQTFLRPQWWLERLPDGQPLAPDVRAEWRQAEGRYIALLMRRALRWLGVVDLALDAQGRLKGFRVTPRGAFLLGAEASAAEALAADASAPAVASPTLLQVDADGALLVPLDALNREALERLLWWCEPAGATVQALRFWPGAERVAAALDAGHDLAVWLGWLEQQPQSAALGALVAQMRGWAALYGQVRLSESVALLEIGDPALLQELEATLDLSARFIDHALASGLAVLRSAAVETLTEEMQRHGYAPWIQDHETPDGP